jgi:3-hydroxybutyryl-CoA dehydrogenase
VFQRFEIQEPQPTLQVKTIGVIGARRMGSRFAAHALRAGYRTILEDVSPEMLGAAIAEVQQSFAGFFAGGDLSAAQCNAAIGGLTTSRSVEDVCRQADMLIESLPEEMEVKLEIFTIFDKFAKPGAILASNTLTFPIADLAEITFRREECVGFRLVNSDPQGPNESSFLEIVRCAETSDATVAACAEVGRRMGKKFIVFTEAHS